MGQCKIVIADDHALFRQGMRRILSEHADLEVVGEAKCGLNLLNLLKKVSPDLILLDISMPGLRGLEAISEIRRMRPNARIIILTMHRDPDYLLQAISSGASGYLLKEDAEKDLFSAIATVRKGGTYVSRLVAEDSMQDWAQMRRGEKHPEAAEPLTVRERQILKLITEGKSSKEIGGLLCISFRTVERHRANMMEKLNLKKTADLIRFAIEKKYV
jgi:DNA-binding NarL/FixJ family response regulator